MNWKDLLSTKQYAKSSNQTDIRSAFQRDYDRIIFSSAFRRLQNKTQVFPLPGSILVHNRLTHSLEVSSVGRSLARIVARELLAKDATTFHGEINEIDTVVAAACLAHDLGNPPFGHSGETAISSYFTDGEGKKLEKEMSPDQWSDLINFEGNANAFRILTHQFNGRREGGFSLTSATLSTLIKYPYFSFNKGSRKKYGVFRSEYQMFIELEKELGIPCLDEEISAFMRHPLSYLVEAADDICYLILDMEDAHKLGIVSTTEVESSFLSFFDKETEAGKQFFDHQKNIYHIVNDKNERMSFLRASVINHLVECASKVFIENYDLIMDGKFQGSLIGRLDTCKKNAIDVCRSESVKKIYNDPDVVKIEITGFNVLGTLMHEFCEAILHPNTTYNQKLLSLLPKQFSPKTDDTYSKIQAIVDYISNMTDVYAMQLYKDLKGIG